MGTLENKVAVITGGTKGFGLAIAKALAAQGSAVIIASRSQDSVQAALQGIRQAGGKAEGMVCDVARLEQVQQLAEKAGSTFGRLDIWVNNAGVAGPYGPTLELAPEKVMQVINTNIIGVYHGSTVAIKHFTTPKSGKLINIMGRGWDSPAPNQNAYGSSKTWIRIFSQTLAKETKESGIGIFAFNPGMMLTDLLTDVEVIPGHEKDLKSFGAVIQMWARSPEIPAQKVAWLASSATDGRTGMILSIDSPFTLLGGALRFGLKRLLKQPLPDVNLRIKPVE